MVIDDKMTLCMIHFSEENALSKRGIWGGVFVLLGSFLLGSVFPAAAQTTMPGTSHEPRWVNPQPDVPYLPKPATRPADWVVEHDPVVPNASPEARAC